MERGGHKLCVWGSGMFKKKLVLDSEGHIRCLKCFFKTSLSLKKRLKKIKVSTRPLPPSTRFLVILTEWNEFVQQNQQKRFAALQLRGQVRCFTAGFAARCYQTMRRDIGRWSRVYKQRFVNFNSDRLNSGAS